MNSKLKMTGKKTLPKCIRQKNNSLNVENGSEYSTLMILVLITACISLVSIYRKQTIQHVHIFIRYFEIIKRHSLLIVYFSGQLQMAKHNIKSTCESSQTDVICICKRTKKQQR